MENVNTIYEIATKEFLQKFETYWQDALNILQSQQTQLVTGNKLRPQVCFWGYLATVNPGSINNYSFELVANVAVSIEMIHKASLLIDDWIDGDIERHGKPTFHAEYGSQYAVLYALNMIGLAMTRLEGIFSDSIVLPHHYHLCLNTLIRTIYSMARGALEEIRLQGDNILNHSKVQEITQLETAEIIGNSMLLGYYTGLNDSSIASGIEQAFKLLGDKCGYLFQLYNDLEAFENPDKLREHKGTLNFDVFRNRKNLVISTLSEVSRPNDREKLQSASEDELLYYIEKYKIMNALKKEANAIFSELLSRTVALQFAGLSPEWCAGFCNFLTYIRGYAEERLK